MDSLFSLLTDVTVDGFALWIVLLICVGVFLGSFMDAIAGGGGIITVPTYLIAFSRLPAYYALGTNKLSAGIGTVFSTARFIKNGLVDWKLFTPARGAGAGRVCRGYLAAAPYAGCSAEIPAALCFAGGGLCHAAKPQLAGPV